MILFAVLAAASWTAAPVPPAPPPHPLKVAQDGFQGEWKVATLVKEGDARPNEELAACQVTVTGNKMSIVTGDTDTNEAATFVLDPTTLPPSINLLLQKEEKKVELVKGIYHVEKDRITISFATPGEERPKGFAPSKTTSVLVLEKAKK